MIVAECKSIENKLLILRSKKQFVRTVGNETHPVYIDSDLPQQDRMAQGRLRAIAKEMLEKGKDVRMGFGSLKVDGEWYQFDQEADGVVKKMFRKKD